MSRQLALFQDIRSREVAGDSLANQRFARPAHELTRADLEALMSQWRKNGGKIRVWAPEQASLTTGMFNGWYRAKDGSNTHGKIKRERIK